MATLYFGALYPPPGRGYSGIWDDTTQWYSNPGSSGEGYFYYGTPVDRLPDPAVDLVYCYRTVQYNFPTTYTGPTQNLRLGTSSIPATGTWSGTHTGAMVIFGNSSSPVITGTINPYSAELYSVRVIGNVSIAGGTFYVSGNTVVTGNISGGGTTYLSNNGIITGNITGTSMSALIYGGTLNGNINGFSIEITTSTIYGSIAASYGFFMTTGTYSTVTLGASLNSFNIYGGSLPNLATISASASINIYNARLNGLTSITGNVQSLQIGSNSILPNLASITGGSIGLNTVDLPRVTSIISSSFLNLTQVITSATLRCNLNGTALSPSIIIYQSTLSGVISYANASASWLRIIGNRTVIGADISTAVSNCTRFEIYGGTFTNPNPWIFGSPSIPARETNIGAGISYLGGPLINSSSYVAESLGLFNKNITIYSNSSNFLYFNYITYYDGYSGWYGVSPRRYTTFTGVINILPSTGGTMPNYSVSNGDYQPIVTVTAIASGTNYVLTSAQLPFDWGFYRDNRPESYRPTIYVTGLPSGVDILATGI